MNDSSTLTKIHIFPSFDHSLTVNFCTKIFILLTHKSILTVLTHTKSILRLLAHAQIYSHTINTQIDFHTINIHAQIDFYTINTHKSILIIFFKIKKKLYFTKMLKYSINFKYNYINNIT